MSEKTALEFGRFMSHYFTLDEEGYLAEYKKYKQWKENKDNNNVVCYDCGEELSKDTAVETNDWGIIVTYCEKHSIERYERITAKPNLRARQKDKHEKMTKEFFDKILKSKNES